MSKGFLLTTHSERNPLVAALTAIGQQVVHCGSLNEVKGRLPGCAGYYGELFDEIKRPGDFTALRRAMRAQGVPYIFWNRDAPWNVGMKWHRAWFLRYLKPVDVYLTHSLQSSDWFTRNRAIYFPNAARKAYCREVLPPALRDDANYAYDVSFFGAIGNRKRRNCRERAAFLDAVRNGLAARGAQMRLKVIDTIHEPLDAEAQVALIQSSKINLNFGAMCDLPGNPSWGMPERVFGIPAAGGFLLTDWRDALPATFDDDSCDFFRDAGECVEKILYYLPRFDQLRARAENLHAQVLGRHTYAHRARELVRLLESHAYRPAA